LDVTRQCQLAEQPGRIEVIFTGFIDVRFGVGIVNERIKLSDFKGGGKPAIAKTDCKSFFRAGILVYETLNLTFGSRTLAKPCVVPSCRH
jgi:hypothetical protein